MCVSTVAALVASGTEVARADAFEWSPEAVSLVANRFAEAHGGDAGFGGVWIEQTGDGPRVVVGVVGKLLTPATVDTGDVAVRQQPVRYSEAALDAELARLVRLNWQRADLSYSAYVDLFNNRVVISPERTSFAEVTRDPGMTVITAPMTSGSTSYQGGQTLTSNCTAGFMVRKSSGPGIGTLTAGHCPNTSVSQERVNGTSAVGLGDATQEVFQGNKDRQIHPAGAPFPVSSTLTNGARITGTVAAVAGDTLCKVGKRTGVLCGRVMSTNYAPSYVPGGTGFIAADMWSLFGDSGGPGYIGTGAATITSGCFTTMADCNTPPSGMFGRNFAVLTKIDNALSGTGYSLYL